MKGHSSYLCKSSDWFDPALTFLACWAQIFTSSLRSTIYISLLLRGTFLFLKVLFSSFIP